MGFVVTSGRGVVVVTNGVEVVVLSEIIHPVVYPRAGVESATYPQ